MESKTKKCTQCHIVKTLDGFYFDQRRGQHITKCKECRRVQMREQKRAIYSPKKEKQRYLRRRKNGMKFNWEGMRDKYPEKHKARWALRNAVRQGRIKKGKCKINKQCHGRIEAHHKDYSKPLDVVWLCQKHHAKLHRKSLSASIARGKK